MADAHREKLAEFYGQTGAKAVAHAEACEYGRQPSPADLRRLSPFFPGG